MSRQTQSFRPLVSRWRVCPAGCCCGGCAAGARLGWLCRCDLDWVLGLSLALARLSCRVLLRRLCRRYALRLAVPLGFWPGAWPLSCVGAPVLPAQGTGPQQPASGSGEPRKRLKLRSAMLNYVSCLGMTTRPTPPTQGSTAPTKSGFSLESEGVLLAKTKRNPSEISFRRLYKGRTTLKPLPGRTLCRPRRRRLYTPPGVCPSWALYW